MATVVATDEAPGVRRLTLDKPPANAIDERLLADLRTALDEAAGDDAVRAVVLTGRGAFFSGGFDFSAPRRDDTVAHEIYELYRDAHLALLTLPKPTIAMINGHCIAGGVVLALACDHRIAAAGGHRVGLNEVAVGASFPRAAFEIVRLRLTHAQAAEMILGAGLYAVDDAVRLGVATEIVLAGELAARVEERATALAAAPREAYAHAKACFVSAAAARIRAETAEEALATMSVWITDESRAARARQRARLG